MQSSRNNIKPIFQKASAFTTSSDGNSVQFENKTVSIGTPLTTSDPEIQLSVSGKTQFGNDMSVTGAVTTDQIRISSDVRLKQNIQPLYENYGNFNNWNAVSYTKNNETIPEIGFVAQELIQHCPELVTLGKTDSDFASINYNNIIGIMVKEIQLLKNRINILETQTNF